MKKSAWLRLPLSPFLILICMEATAQIQSPPVPWAEQETLQLNLRARRFTTEAYKNEALKALLEDASRLAQQLRLPERLPIQSSDVIESYISPPFWSETVGRFGTVATPNYRYSANEQNKLCHVQWSQRQYQPYIDAVKQRYPEPKSEMERSQRRAYALATNWLASAGADLKSLEGCSKVEFRPIDLGDTFVPIYWVVWRQPTASVKAVSDNGDGFQTVASVWLAEPERKLLQMDVAAEYMNRPPLAVANRERLLLQTDDSLMRQLWFTTDSYEQAALETVLKEVDWVCRALTLPENLPITRSRLTRINIASPYMADHFGNFATIGTSNYLYSVVFGNKLCWVQKNLSSMEEGAYLGRLKAKYSLSKSLMNTNAAYTLATQWLAAVSVDLKALNRDCAVTVTAWDLGERFVPLYDVIWNHTATRTVSKAAEVEVLLPESVFESLIVFDTGYMERAALVISNREGLLRPAVREEK